MYIAPWRPKIQRRSEDGELNQTRSKPHPVDWPVRTARTTVQHYDGGTHYCSTETVLLIFPFLQTNIISQTLPCADKWSGSSKTLTNETSGNRWSRISAGQMMTVAPANSVSAVINTITQIDIHWNFKLYIQWISTGSSVGLRLAPFAYKIFSWC